MTNNLGKDICEMGVKRHSRHRTKDRIAFTWNGKKPVKFIVIKKSRTFSAVPPHLNTVNMSGQNTGNRINTTVNVSFSLVWTYRVCVTRYLCRCAVVYITGTINSIPYASCSVSFPRAPPVYSVWFTRRRLQRPRRNHKTVGIGTMVVCRHRTLFLM